MQNPLVLPNFELSLRTVIFRNFRMVERIWSCVIIGLLLTACEPAQPPESTNNPTFIAITAKSVDGISLDADWYKSIKYLSQKSSYQLDTVDNQVFNLDGGGKGMLIRSGNEKLYYIYRKEHRPERIAGIIVLSDKCRTEEGIHIGMSIGELSLLLADFNIKPNLLPPPEEIYLPEKYQIYRHKRQYSAFTIGFYSADGKLLGKYAESEDYTEKGTIEFNSLNGNVATIEMHVIE